MSTSLLEQTKTLLQTRRQTLNQIATGANVDYSWLAKFSQGRIPDPSVRKVQAVHDYLSEHRDTDAA